MKDWKFSIRKENVEVEGRKVWHHCAYGICQVLYIKRIPPPHPTYKVGHHGTHALKRINTTYAFT